MNLNWQQIAIVASTALFSLALAACGPAKTGRCLRDVDMPPGSTAEVNLTDCGSFTGERATFEMVDHEFEAGELDLCSEPCGVPGPRVHTHWEQSGTNQHFAVQETTVECRHPTLTDLVTFEVGHPGQSPSFRCTIGADDSSCRKLGGLDYACTFSSEITAS